MNGKRNLRFFLMKWFLLLLLLVGVAEAILNALFHGMIFPWMNEHFGLSQYFGEVGLTELVGVVLQSLFFLLLGKVAEILPGGIAAYIETQFANRLEHNLFQWMAAYTEDFSAEEVRLYVTIFVIIVFLLLLLWLLPYGLAAVSFGTVVSRRAAELEEEERKKQEEYERQRNLLLSDVAHDLKTPMTAVAGYAHALAAGDVTEEAKKQEYLEIIRNKTMQMNELLLLLFEYVKLDSEGFSLKLAETDLAELLRETVAAQYTDFEEKEMELAVEVPEEPRLYPLDAVQFQRAVRNLLTNAIKHNPPGTAVGVRFVETDSAYVISVWDSGVRIPEETAAHLFEPFVQGDASRKSKGGSGLGLSITQKVIAMHGGTIRLWQEDVLYRGTIQLRQEDVLHEGSILLTQEEKYGDAATCTKAFVITLPKPREEY